MKKIYLSVAALVILSFLIFSAKKGYNLVFISIDSLRPNSIKANAPNIVKFSESATVFENAYTIYPSSVGSYYTLFTGNNYLVSNELSTLKFIDKFDSTKNKDYVNLPSRLKKMGYSTSALIANPKLNSGILSYGFDEFKDKLDNETVAKNAVEKIKTSGEKRFFLWVDFKIPEIMDVDEEKKLFTCSPKSYLKESYDKKIFVDYSKNVGQVDMEVSKVIAAINEAGIAKNTLVVIYSDRGENFERRYYGFGKTLYNHDVKSTLIVKEPLQMKSQTIFKMIDNSNISNFILSRLEKSKILKKIDEFTNSGLTFFRISYGKNLKVATTDGKYKFIYNLTTDSCLPEKDLSEFYDIIADPNEKNNLINDQTKQKKIEEMKAALSRQTLVPIKKPGEKIDVIDRLKSLGY